MTVKLVTYNSQNYAGTLGSGLGQRGQLPLHFARWEGQSPSTFQYI